MKKSILGVFLITGSLFNVAAPGFAAVGTAPEVFPPVPVVEKKSDAAAVAKEKGDEMAVMLKFPLTSPLFTGVTVATVNDEKITIDDLFNAVAAMHEGREEINGEAVHGKTFTEPMRRLVNAKLILQESRNMDLDGLPEVVSAINEYGERMMREILYRELIKDLKIDDKEVEALYQRRCREWKMKSVLFKKETDAKRFEQELKKGKDFEQLAAKAVKDGLAERGEEEKYVPRKALHPSMLTSVMEMKTGSTSQVISLVNGFLVFKVVDSRFVEEPQEKATIRTALEGEKRIAMLRKAKERLIKKYLKLNTKLIDSLDIEAKKPGYEALLKDKRVLATAKGEKPILVSDLMAALNTKFFHGVERAIQEKKINKIKKPLLDDLLARVALKKEAQSRGIDKSDDYRKRMEDYKQSIYFGSFVDGVIKPGVKVTEEDIKAYYDEHVNDYTFPEMYKIEEIVFTAKEDADSALVKLQQGMDLKWLKSNADRQVPAETVRTVAFGGQLVSGKALPEDLQKILSGAKPGEYRLYADSEGFFHVLFVDNSIPSRLQPIEEVASEIKTTLYPKKVESSVNEWVEKLRQAADIKYYLTN